MMLYFSLLKVLVLPSSKSLFRPSQSLGFVLFRVLVSPSSKSRFLPSLSVPFLPLRPLPSSRSPLPSSSKSRARPLRFTFLPFRPLPFLSKSSSVLFHPPQSQKKRNDTKPSRRSWLVWLVLKWNIVLLLLLCDENQLRAVREGCSLGEEVFAPLG